MGHHFFLLLLCHKQIVAVGGITPRRLNVCLTCQFNVTQNPKLAQADKVQVSQSGRALSALCLVVISVWRWGAVGCSASLLTSLPRRARKHFTVLISHSCAYDLSAFAFGRYDFSQTAACVCVEVEWSWTMLSQKSKTSHSNGSTKFPNDFFRLSLRSQSQSRLSFAPLSRLSAWRLARYSRLILWLSR